MIFQIFEAYPEIDPRNLKYLKQNGHKIHHHWHNVDKKTIEGVIIRSKTIVDKNFLLDYPNLKYILRLGVGLDNIDLELIKQKNIIIKNTPGANANSVAQIVLWGILSLLRNTATKWSSLDDRHSFLGEELSDKKIGLVGFGAISKKLFKMIDSLGDNHFIIYDPYINPKDFEEYKNLEFTLDKKYLFQNSDIISFHIPLNNSTKDFLSGEDFNLLKKDTKIINTSRGGIINENDLINFLQTNQKSGAYIDTWEGEPNIYNPNFKKLNNIIITPHIGAMTSKSIQNMHKFDI